MGMTLLQPCNLLPRLGLLVIPPLRPCPRDGCIVEGCAAANTRMTGARVGAYDWGDTDLGVCFIGWTGVCGCRNLGFEWARSLYPRAQEQW
eukprot:scaffold274952_cov30-Tisochrysis_lutea.AAC.2